MQRKSCRVQAYDFADLTVCHNTKCFPSTLHCNGISGTKGSANSEHQPREVYLNLATITDSERISIAMCFIKLFAIKSEIPL